MEQSILILKLKLQLEESKSETKCTTKNPKRNKDCKFDKPLPERSSVKFKNKYKKSKDKGNQEYYPSTSKHTHSKLENNLITKPLKAIKSIIE